MMLAYHNDQAVKDKYLARVVAHRAADRLIVFGCLISSFSY